MLTELEAQCLGYLTHRYESSPGTNVSRDTILHELRISDADFELAMRRLHHLGAISVQSTDAKYGFSITPLPGAFDVKAKYEHSAREAARPPDIVAQLKEAMHRNPGTAWLLISFAGLTALGTLISTWWDVIERIVRLIGQSS
ncbi:MAG TPA: hypothetical protein VGN12_12120 [Pirellulales bacterium]